MVIFHIKLPTINSSPKGPDNLFVLVSMPNRSLPKKIESKDQLKQIKLKLTNILLLF